MTDDAEHDAAIHRSEARMEYAEELYEERKARLRRHGCLCGYPDWPGQCPGPAACPVHGENLEREDEPQ